MSCGTGCTDCPTCRGEVQPDAPVMKDMAFAMAMTRDPMTRDRVMGPLSIAQMVRNGVRARDSQTRADSIVLDFVDAVSARSKAPGVGLGPSATSSARHNQSAAWASFDPFLAPPDLTKIKNPKISGLQPKSEASTLRKKAGQQADPSIRVPPLDPGGIAGGPTRLGEVTPGSKPELRSPDLTGPGQPSDRPSELRVPPMGAGARVCCVNDFFYPEHIRSMSVKVRGKPTWRLAFEFWVYAEYEESGTCACACCHFEQYARRSGPDGDTGRGLRQDCWWNDSSGNYQNTVYDEAPPGTELNCAGGSGDRITTGGAAPGSLLHVGNFTQLGASNGVCEHRWYDQPATSQVSAPEEVTWTSLGVVLDTCQNWTVKRVGMFTWTEKVSKPGGPASGGGQAELDDGTGYPLRGDEPIPGDIEPASKDFDPETGKVKPYSPWKPRVWKK